MLRSICWTPLILVLVMNCVSAQDASKTVGSGIRSLLSTDSSPTPTEKKDTPSETSGSKKIPARTVANTKEANEPKDLRKVDRKELKETPSTQGGESYLMRYKMTPGLRISSEVTHLAKTDTKIESTEQASTSRTVSHKMWEVISEQNGTITFEYRILDIDMSQKVGDGPELTYSSEKSDPVLPQFQAAADSIGKVISTVTIDPQGLIIARSDENNPPNLGMGDITLPVPEKAVAIGATWETPREMRIRREDGSQKQVKFRELYKLEKVSSGIATVSVRSEMITIISDPKEEAQVLQQLSNGIIKFDLDAGRMISKELTWDKRVVGFAGAGSTMEYSARLDEQVTKTESTAPKARSAKK